MVLVLKGNKFDKLYINSDGYKNVIVQNINPDHYFSDKHRAVMSRKFASEIIREFTMDGETVLDPFMGLATTGICCVEQGRDFIGCEIHKPYFEIAKDRVHSIADQYSIFNLT